MHLYMYNRRVSCTKTVIWKVLYNVFGVTAIWMDVTIWIYGFDYIRSIEETDMMMSGLL